MDKESSRKESHDSASQKIEEKKKSNPVLTSWSLLRQASVRTCLLLQSLLDFFSDCLFTN